MHIGSCIQIAMMSSTKSLRRWISNESISTLSQRNSSERCKKAKISLSSNSGDDKDEDENEDEDRGERKGNIYIGNHTRSQCMSRSINSFRSCVSRFTPSSTAAMELYTVESCFICLKNHKVGEKILWSRNDQCSHSTCMLRWLMGHNNCPLCREDYLNVI